MDIYDAPIDKTIFVGAGHSGKVPCSMSANGTYMKTRILFHTPHHGDVVFSVKRCNECGAIFLPYLKYEKHCFDLKGYCFIRSTTAKPPYQEDIKAGRFKPDPNYVPPAIDPNEVFKTPEYIRNAIRHPYSGGRTSPR